MAAVNAGGEEPDVFSAVASRPPEFDTAEASAIAETHFGIACTASALVSERDQNFLLNTRDGEKFVLKIANAKEDRVVTEFQLAALAHIEANAAEQRLAPRIVATRDGEPAIVVTKDGESHLCRVVTYLPGLLLADVAVTPELSRNFGRFIAALDSALSSFDHPGARQVLLWDMQRALKLRKLLRHVTDPTARTLVEKTLDEFETLLLPGLDRLPTQVIHNDANPGNVLVGQDAVRVVGVIDFGDMLRAPRIVEVAVACAYLRELQADPLTLIRAFVAGYHSVNPLAPAELRVLHAAIKTRLATTIVVMAWRSSLRESDDAYLLQTQSSEDDALDFLRRLDNVSHADASDRYAEITTTSGS